MNLTIVPVYKLYLGEKITILQNLEDLSIILETNYFKLARYIFDGLVNLENSGDLDCIEYEGVLVYFVYGHINKQTLEDLIENYP